MSEYEQIVTIDGPSGVGKSTVSRFVASQLGFTYLDTGAMYRGVALYIHRMGIEAGDEKAIAPLLEHINLTLVPSTSADGDVGVFLNGEDVSSLVRTPEMSMKASKISALPCVRTYLTGMQREIANKGRVVAEGRDMGTVVFPRASNKFFLDAKVEERCKRRVDQLKSNGVDVDEKEILQMILERDKNDSERAMAPLKKADDALLVDTTNLTIAEVCRSIIRSVEKSVSP